MGYIVVLQLVKGEWRFMISALWLIPAVFIGVLLGMLFRGLAENAKSK